MRTTAKVETAAIVLWLGAEVLNVKKWSAVADALHGARLVLPLNSEARATAEFLLEIAQIRDEMSRNATAAGQLLGIGVGEQLVEAGE